MDRNPFVWTEAIKGGVPRRAFAERVGLALQGGTHVALFGSRGIGKTTFLGQLAGELPNIGSERWTLVYVDLRRAVSLRAFTGAVSAAIADPPSRLGRRRSRIALRDLEAEIKVNVGLVELGIRSKSRRTSISDDGELLFSYLRALTKISDRLVVAFDEFQRLASCPGEPLSIIRSALMGPTNAGGVSLVLTGSLRERLELMLHTSTEPIWNQTLDLQLPDLDELALLEYIENCFHSTGRAIEDRAVERLVELTQWHPKQSQYLAWHVWDRSSPNQTIVLEDVFDVFEELIAPGSAQATDSEMLLDTLLNGDEADVNDARALLLLASGGRPGSHIRAHAYGLGHPSTTQRALERLRKRGITTKTSGEWKIVDPLLSAWLKRQNPLEPEKRGLNL